jgi:hypothetical protein
VARAGAEDAQAFGRHGARPLGRRNVENRGRAPIEVGSVAVNKGTLESKEGYLSDSTIEFQKVSSGVMSLRLPDSDNTKGPFELTISETTGKHRVVTVRGVEF